MTASGELSAWQATTPLSQPRANFSVTHHNNHIYVIGGSNNAGYLTSVEYAMVNNEGDIGYWGSVVEAGTHNSAVASIKAQKSQLPNQGMVQEIIQTAGYTYLRVLKDDGSIEWLAGPKLAVAVASGVRYGEGVYMPNFYSKELQRNFPMVLFVGQVQKVE